LLDSLLQEKIMSDYDYESPLEYSEDEYNSEDDEFLAFHDAEIEAQVRAEIEKIKQRRDVAIEENKSILMTANQELVASIKEQQIKLLGTPKLFDRVNTNLLKHKFEAYFAKEQFQLFSWREDFFHAQFPEESWFTSGADDAHSFDTVPFQITQNFDYVVALAASDKPTGSKIYFENNETKSARARNLFDSNTVMYMDNFLEPETLEDYGLTFGDTLHIIQAVFPGNKPLRLGHIAMKKVLETQVSQEELPRGLQEKAAKGMFNSVDEVLEFLDDQGVETVEMLRKNFYN